MEKLHDKILNAFKETFKAGIEWPLGAELGVSQHKNKDIKMTVYKDYLLAEMKNLRAQDDNPSRRKRMSASYDPQKDQETLLSYPVTWIVDQDHEVTTLVANDDANEKQQQCKGKNCRVSDSKASYTGTNHSDEL